MIAPSQLTNVVIALQVNLLVEKKPSQEKRFSS